MKKSNVVTIPDNVSANKAAKKAAAMPVYKILPVKRLSVETYQRALNTKQIKEIVKNYNPFLLGIAVVSKRKDGTMAILDGHHRCVALERLGIEFMMCQVLEGLTVEEEAEIYLQLNTERRPLNANEKFVAKVKKKDDIALNIVAILAKHGFSYSIGSGVKEKNKLACVSSCEYIYKRLGVSQFDNLFYVIKNAWNGSSDSLHVQIIRGVATFIGTCKDYYDKEFLIKVLSREDAVSLLIEASTIADSVSQFRRDNNCVHVAKVIWSKYEKSSVTDGRKGIPYLF